MELTKELILDSLKNEKLMKAGECIQFAFMNWNLTIRKEDPIYRPFTFSVTGRHTNGSTWDRRYIDMSTALLHILNHFNENANIKNRYKTINDVIIDTKSEIE